MDSSNERLLSLSEASRLIPLHGGRHPHTSTLWRWCRRGLKGTRLEYVRGGRAILTSEEAVGRFLNRLAEMDDLDFTPDEQFHKKLSTPTEKQRSHEIARANEELESHGI